MSESTLYRKIEARTVAELPPLPNGSEVESWNGLKATAWVPVEPVRIRWCMSHRRETWSGRTTCVGMGGDLTNSCNVVDALLMIGDDE